MIPMTDVSCRLTQGLLEYLDQINYLPEAWIAKIGLRVPNEIMPTSEFLRNPKNRMSWDFFAAGLDILDEDLPAGWELKYLEGDIETDDPFLPHVKSLASMITSPLQAYRMLNVLSGPSLFGTVVVATMESLGAREMVTTLTIQKPHRDSVAFFRISATGMRIFPRMLGLPDSVVRCEIVDRQARYYCTMPPSQTLWARIARSAKLAFSVDHFIKEFSVQEAMFREHYAKLEKSEAELQESRRVLEERVRQRTFELSKANELLAAQIQDIVQKENENRQLQERLFHLQKVDAIGTLASGISHEMNNVLQGLVLSLELAGRNISPGHPAHAPLSTAQKFASRGRDVMKQLLTFSRKSRAERRHLEVVSTIQEAVDLARSILPHNIVIKQLYPASPKRLTIFGDRTQIQQVIINLVSNSVHALKQTGGEIAIEIQDLGANCAVVVRDNGPGISPEIQAQIFEPFFTTKPVGEGTGMGLSIAHDIVTSHLGRIDSKKMKTRGAEFTITLPLSIQPVESVAPAPANTDDLILNGGDETILVVDDEEDLTVVIGDTLEIFGYKILKATSAESALKLLESLEEPVDLILTDDSMPGLTGVEFAKLLKSRSVLEHSIPVVVMTGNDRHEPQAELDAMAVHAFLRKPLDAENLNEVIRSTLDRASH